jgi:hypothetical protein
MPSTIMPKLPSSWVSEYMPTLPLNAGSHRSASLVIGRPVFFSSYAMPVMPEAHGTL